MARKKHITIKADAVNEALRNTELVADMFECHHKMYLEDDYVLVFIAYPYSHVWVQINYGGDGLSVRYRKSDEEYENSEDNHVYNTVEYANAKDMYVALVSYFSDKEKAARV